MTHPGVLPACLLAHICLPAWLQVIFLEPKALYRAAVEEVRGQQQQQPGGWRSRQAGRQPGTRG